MLRSPVGLAVAGVFLGGALCMGIAVVKIVADSINKACRAVGRT